MERIQVSQSPLALPPLLHGPLPVISFSENGLQRLQTLVDPPPLILL